MRWLPRMDAAVMMLRGGRSRSSDFPVRQTRVCLPSTQVIWCNSTVRPFSECVAVET